MFINLNINKHSSHPPSILNLIPSMINNRISQNSCDKNHFDKAAPDYNIALKYSRFNENVIARNKLFGSTTLIVLM